MTDFTQSMTDFTQSMTDFTQKYDGFYAKYDKMPAEKTQKKCEKYCCDTCGFITVNKTDYKRHVSSNKHKNLPAQSSYICNFCKKIYSSRQYLWKHKKICKNIEISPVKPSKNDDVMSSDEESDDDNDDNESQQSNTIQPNPTNIIINKDVLLQILSDNQEFKKMMIEQNEKIIELSQTANPVDTNNNITNNNIVTTTNNNNNTQNNNFNLNIFLNETCKNAVNWTDFIQGIEITPEDLLRTGEMGFVNGVSHLIIKELKELSVEMRPIHNTDSKRKTVYVRDDSSWEVQEDYKRFVQAAGVISDKTKLAWIKTNDDNLSEEDDNALMKACVNMAATTEHMEKIPKIANKVLREVIVNKK
jgi:hypothetical protein